MTKQDFYKQVFEDFFNFLKGPKSFLADKLDNFDPAWIGKKWIAFVFFMHIYYVFMPSFLISTNVVGLFFVFFGIGVFYYLSQICLFEYEPEQTEQKKLYVFAYAFALAELLGFILNILILFFSFGNLFSIISALFLSALMFPVAILVLVLKLSIFKLIEPDNFSLLTFIKFLIQAMIATVKNKLGLNAWRELWADYNSEPY